MKKAIIITAIVFNINFAFTMEFGGHGNLLGDLVDHLLTKKNNDEPQINPSSTNQTTSKTKADKETNNEAELFGFLLLVGELLLSDNI